MFQAKLMSPHSETDTLLSWPQSGSRAASAAATRPRRRDRDEYGGRRPNTRRHPSYDLTFRPNSAILYHPPPLRLVEWQNVGWQWFGLEVEQAQFF